MIRARQFIALLLISLILSKFGGLSWAGVTAAMPQVSAAYSAHGVLDIVRGDGPEKAGETRYYLSTSNGTHTRLVFSKAPFFGYFAKTVHVQSASPAKLVSHAGLTESTVQVSGMSLATPPGQPQPAEGPFLGAVTGTRKMIILLLKYSEDTSVPHDPTFYTNLVNPTTGNSVNAFYLANSWNQFSVQADVTSWMTLPHAKSYYAPCGWTATCANLNAITNDGIALGLANGANFADYDMISFGLSNDLDCCAWGGTWYGTISGVTKSWSVTWMPPWSQQAGVYSHEIGHSIGLPHSGWVYYDYDSPWDAMSGGDFYNGVACDSYFSANSGATVTMNCYSAADIIAAYKDILGWVDSGHLLTSPSGTLFNGQIDSLAAPMGSSYKMIKICFSGYSCVSGGATSRYLTLETRTRYGFDQYLPGEGVIIHQFEGERGTVTGSCFFIDDNPPAYPIDSTPTDFNSASCAGTGLDNAQWTVGQTYNDVSTLGSNSLTIVSQSGASPNPATFSVALSGNSQTQHVNSVGSQIVSAAANSVVYVLPDWQTSQAKPSGVTRAQLSDFTALGFMYGSSTNPQILALDTNNTYFDQMTGTPNTSSGVFAVFAGPAVNEVVQYYENTRQAPVYFQYATVGGTTSFAWYNLQGSMVASMPVSTAQAGTSDMFLIEYFTDANNNKIFIVYGFTWKGTLAGGIFFKTYMMPNLAGFTHEWYVFQWNDANGNGFTDPFEVNITPVNFGD